MLQSTEISYLKKDYPLLLLNEFGINMKNPFSGTFIPDDNKKKIRLPIPIKNIRNIQTECKNLNDDKKVVNCLD